MKLPWQFEEPMGQVRAMKVILAGGRRTIFVRKARAWWHSRRYLGVLEAWRFVGAMEAIA